MNAKKNAEKELHESFVKIANLLDVHVELGIDERFDGAVSVGDGDDGSHVLEIRSALHLHLAQASVSVADLDDGRQTGSRYLNETTTTTTECNYHKYKMFIILQAFQQ